MNCRISCISSYLNVTCGASYVHVNQVQLFVQLVDVILNVPLIIHLTEYMFYNSVKAEQGKIIIDCLHDYICGDIVVSADNIYDIQVNCETGEDDYERTCYDFILYANNANTVNVVGHHLSHE